MIPFLATHLPRACAGRFPDVLWRMPADERSVYLTFDDGPTAAMTADILDLLDRFDAAATFFLLGANAEARPALVDATLRAGHTIGNHSYSHPDAWRTPRARVLEELDRTTILLERLTGEPIRFMRPPYGRFTPAMRQWCRAHCQQLTMWDVMPGDFLPGATAERLRRHMLKTVRPGSVIVLHDNPKARAMPEALEGVLQVLSRDGWTFRAL